MPSEVIAGRYELLQELGRGGMGAVFRAHDRVLARDVAVKLPARSALGTEGQARLLAEARAAASLDHPNIVSVYDAGEADGQPFIVMQLVEGTSLRDAERPSRAETIDIILQLCAALDHAHQKGIVHRDVKPENILLAGPSDRRTVRLTDFGLARSVSASRLTSEEGLSGTVYYLAPEQIRNESVDGRTDLYALGVVFYELATGQTPFSGDALAIIGQHLQAEPHPPSSRTPDVGTGLDAVILRLMAKNPADRYPTAADVAEALRSLEGGIEPGLPPSRRRGNLPEESSSFVGRVDETAEVERLLAESRLVTVTGSGGCGKTRLALHVAGRVAADFPDGVWHIELASVSEPELLPQTLGATLGVQESSEVDVVGAILQHLRPLRVLIVLDNLEHLIGAAASLCEAILRSAPEAKFLTTSREALGIPGEVSFRVPSLGLPAVGADQAEGDWEHYDALLLFAERARMVDPRFVLGPDTGPHVAKICRRLDGVPLAIELAAARVSVLTVAQIADRLDDRFRLLTGGRRTALPRQQTLRATIDWSYSLLSEPERLLFRRLSVFHGGWSLEAAEAICADDKLAATDVLDLTGRLVDKSMIFKTEDGGEGIFRRLETIRQYALEKLVDSSETEQIRARHAAWYADLADEHAAQLLRLESLSGMIPLDRELDNFRGALEWALEQRPDIGLRLAGALGHYWEVRGLWREGREMIARALETAGEPMPAGGSNALYWQGLLAYRQGSLDEARLSMERSEEACRTTGDRAGIARALNGLGLVSWSAGQYPEAESFLEQALEIRRDLGQTREVAGTLSNLGILASSEGDFDRSRRLQAESLAYFREAGDAIGTATAANNLGLEVERAGDLERAIELFEESIAASRAIGAQGTLAYSISSLAHALAGLGRLGEAQARHAESLRLFWELGDRRGVAYALEGLGHTAIAEGDPRLAALLLGSATGLRIRLSAPLDPRETEELGRDQKSVEEALGPEDFAQSWAEGETMRLEEVVALALRPRSR